MSDPAYINVSLLLMLLLVFVLALLMGRRLRPKSGEDWRKRYVRARRLCIFYVVLTALMTFAAFQRPDQALFKRLLSPGLFTVIFGIFLFQCLQARRKWREQPGFVEPVKRPTPAFFWQGVLILLPVALMAGFGFWAILRERSAVEQQARQRAKEILASLPDEFGRIVASRLTDLDGAKDGWYRYLQGGIAAWPGSKNRQQWLADTNEAQIITRNLAELHAAFPGWQEGPVPLVSFSLKANGDLSFDQPIPPRPPTWLAIMTAGQLQAWTALQSAAYASESSSNLTALFEAFQRTQSPSPALINAKFIRLRASLPALAATNAINQLLQFAGRHYEVISESGVPLRTLALAEALNRARDCGPTARLWESLRSEVSSPTALTSILLDKAGQLAAQNAPLTEAVQAMRILLADKQAQSELAAAVKQSGKLSGITTTNLWLDAMNRRWFCILSRSATQNFTSISNRPVSTIIPITEVQCYPQSIVAHGFAEALNDAKVSLPPYFSFTLELEGERVPLPSAWSRLGDGQPSGDILAEEHFQMSQRAGTTIGDSGDGQAERKALFLAMPDSKQEGRHIFFENMPSHPQFSMQIRLTDRSLLYAKQRQLQLIFGALIAASALAALIGFVTAWRAFRRQQQLNEMKSNFVSSVSHELRAPIASVRLMAENLERGAVAGPQKQHEYFRFIGQECRRLSALIENILDFSRIEQNRKQYEFEPTDLSALVQQTVKLMEPCATERGVELKLHSELRIPNSELEVDGRAIQQALVNLLDNAIKHSDSGGTVTVEIKNAKLKVKNDGGAPASSTARTDAGDQRAVPEAGAPVVSLSVTDAGSGIPAAEHKKIFERFYRRGSELQRETQGVGIGLSIVKHIVAAHGGTVFVQSEPGHGSRFTIELPVKTLTTDAHG